jgi:hypothetical protein
MKLQRRLIILLNASPVLFLTIHVALKIWSFVARKFVNPPLFLVLTAGAVTLKFAVLPLLLQIDRRCWRPTKRQHFGMPCL